MEYFRHKISYRKKYKIPLGALSGKSPSTANLHL